MSRLGRGLAVFIVMAACTPSAGSLGTSGEPPRPSGIVSAGQDDGEMEDMPDTSGGGGTGTSGSPGTSGRPGTDTADPSGADETSGSPGDDGGGGGDDASPGEGSTGGEPGSTGEVDEPPPPQSLPEFGCEEEGNLASQSWDQYVYLEMTNVSGEPRRVVWLDYEGDRNDLGQFGPGQTVGVESFVTHPLMITDAGGQCITIFVVEAGMHSIDVY